MTTFDSVTDSGERRDFGTGSVRDQSEGKGRYDLLEPYAIKRLAQHFENGAKKYGDNNWKLGQPLSVYLDSGIRHGFNLLEGQTNEDHAAAMAWNAMAFISTKHWIDEGKLPKELDDIDWDVVEEEPEAIVEPLSSAFKDVGWITDGATISFDVGAVKEDALKLFWGGDLPITMGGPVDDEEPEEQTFEIGDRVRHTMIFPGMDDAIGVVTALDDRSGGDMAVAWESGAGIAGHTLGTLAKNLELIERPEAPTGRVSVRKIAQALEGKPFGIDERLFGLDGREVRDLTMGHEDVVTFLDALEDAGYEVTYAPKA
jgi:hypothetical protein